MSLRTTESGAANSNFNISKRLEDIASKRASPMVLSM